MMEALVRSLHTYHYTQTHYRVQHWMLVAYEAFLQVCVVGLHLSQQQDQPDFQNPSV